jgi:hypothetical protein
MWIPRPLSEWIGVDMVWSLLLTAVVFGTSMLLYERVHGFAVNKEMQRILSERGAAPNGGPGTSSGEAGATEGPPSVS